MTDPFTQHRPLLFSVAYDLLGSAADAEDVVQETWLRWSARAGPEIAEPRAYLTRIASRLALNRLRSVRARRESYPGPWLPEPLLTAPDVGAEVAEHAERGREISIALLVVLETLSPAERAVFVLRDVFAMPYDEIGSILGRSSPPSGNWRIAPASMSTPAAPGSTPILASTGGSPSGSWPPAIQVTYKACSNSWRLTWC